MSGKTNTLLRFALVGGACVLTTGCAEFLKRPVVSESLAEDVHIVSTSASRRANFLADPAQKLVVCIEPQPDVRENLSRAFAAGAQAGTQVGADGVTGMDAQVITALVETLATANVQRSVSVEYLRAGIFALCQQKYNQAARVLPNTVSPASEAADLSTLFTNAAQIAIAEAAFAKQDGAPGKDPAAVGSVSGTVADVERLVDSLAKLKQALADVAPDKPISNGSSDASPQPAPPPASTGS